MASDRERAVEFIRKHNFGAGAGRTFAEISLRNEFTAIRKEERERAAKIVESAKWPGLYDDESARLLAQFVAAEIRGNTE